MNAKTEQAIRTIDNHLSNMASRRLINQVTLQQLTNCLKQIIETIETDATNEAQHNALTEEILKARAIIRLCGITPKGIDELRQYDLDFLNDEVEHFANNEDALPLPFPIALDYIRAQARVKQLLSELKTDDQQRDSAYIETLQQIIANDPQNQKAAKLLQELQAWN